MGQRGTRALSVRMMAEALGVSKSQIQRDAANGMPMHSPAAARAWRARNVDSLRAAAARLGGRAQGEQASTAKEALRAPTVKADASTVVEVHRLAALAAVDFAGHELQLRTALRALPVSARDDVRIDSAVWDRLTGLHEVQLFDAALIASTVQLDAEASEDDLVWLLATRQAAIRQ